MEVLFLKKHIHTQRLQLTYGLQESDSVTGEAGYGFRDHHIHFSAPAIFHKPLELCAGILSPCQGLIRVDTGELPSGVFLDEFVIVADLCGQGMEHGVLPGGYTGIRRNSDPLGELFREGYLFDRSCHKRASFVST